MTFIYVTHDQHEAMSMSDRVAVMREGRILQVAPPEDLYMRPQSLEVARFVGAPRINVVPGDILANGCRFPLRSDPVFPSRIDPGDGMSRRAGFGSSW